MARYTINYLTGDIETVTADRSEYDLDSRSLLLYANEQPVAWIPQANVRSVHREGDKTGTEYPYQDGDFTILGPHIFTGRNGDTICWKGTNYIRQNAKAVTG